uniref:sn-1-specific diacylglycerol lipase n=1 Tax=Paramoeba aestuarina TaxID=180227 RepID=A0A7S4KJ84_9EUKA|mmetsp:Transcript_20168/g.31568  ORF Transcript_20168/g.31568 Transcript_20168/m.31568 type:complete len:600 (+) Transcript_20168:36-1835(+)
MARLRWLGCEWNIAADDLVVPSALCCMSITAYVGASMMIAVKSERIVRRTFITLPCVLPLALLGAQALASLILGILSSRVLIPSPRSPKAVVSAITGYACILCANAVFIILRITNIVQSEPASRLCALLEKGCYAFFTFTICFICLFWKWRLQKFLSLLIPKYLRSERIAFEKLRDMMSVIFDDHGLAPSDVIAGLILLGHHQFGSIARSPHRNQPIAKESLDAVSSELKTYFSYAMAAYGFPMLDLRSMMRVLGRSLTNLVLRRPSRHSLDIVSVSMRLRCTPDDLIDYDPGGAVYQPAFYVYHSQSTHEVIIAIRGTMSLTDCITDLFCHPTDLVYPGDTLEPNALTGKVHFGMHEAAHWILRRLDEKGILQMLGERGRFIECRIAIIGHSLGAGVATILTMLMRERFRSRIRCMAYAPPGGLLDRTLSESTRDYISAIFLGDDVVPRLSHEAVQDLRGNTIRILDHCQRHKLFVFWNWNTYHVQMFADASFAEQVTCPSTKLYPPANIIQVLAPVRNRFHRRAAGRSFIGKFRDYRRLLSHDRELCERFEKDSYRVRYVSIDDLKTMHRIFVSPKMFTDHLPWKLQEALLAVCEAS